MTTPALTSNPVWQPDLDAYDQSLRDAKTACARFIAEMEADLTPRWLTLSGNPGVGKTMLARQVYERSQKSNPGNVAVWINGRGVYDEAKRRPNCVWLTANRFAERLRDGEYDLPEYFKPDWCVVMDDLGAARDKSDFVADSIYRFCNSRLGKWTVFTTNFTLNEIADRVDARVASRLVRDGNKVVRITSPDYALKKRP